MKNILFPLAAESSDAQDNRNDIRKSQSDDEHFLISRPHHAAMILLSSGAGSSVVISHPRGKIDEIVGLQ
jgi:hypothetical protein